MRTSLHVGVLKRLLLALTILTLAPLLVVHAPRALAAAAPFTQTLHSVTESFDDTLPCMGVLHITITYGAVFHSTSLPNGAFHFTFAQTGDLAAQMPGNPASRYTGQVTIWDGGNVNQSSQRHTVTFLIHGTGADGSSVDF